MRLDHTEPGPQPLRAVSFPRAWSPCLRSFLRETGRCEFGHTAGRGGAAAGLARPSSLLLLSARVRRRSHLSTIPKVYFPGLTPSLKLGVLICAPSVESTFKT